MRLLLNELLCDELRLTVVGYQVRSLDKSYCMAPVKTKNERHKKCEEGGVGTGVTDSRAAEPL